MDSTCVDIPCLVHLDVWLAGQASIFFSRDFAPTIVRATSECAFARVPVSTNTPMGYQQFRPINARITNCVIRRVAALPQWADATLRGVLPRNFARLGGHMSSHDTDEVDIASYCGRLTCGKAFIQAAGRGRPKEFCSETCRRAADRDYKRARGRVGILDEQLRWTQHEVAAYGRRAEEGRLTPEQLSRLEMQAQVALTRATTVVELGASPDRTLEELEALIAAVRPVLNIGAQHAIQIA